MKFSKSRFLPLFAVLFGISFFSQGQEKCGTVAYEKLRRQQNPRLESTDHFEKWMVDKVSLARLKSFSANRSQTPTYIIPVVVHVIHNGEAVGTGINISDAQIQSQIDILNLDYPRLNADASSTLSEFQSVAGSIDMQFVLAKQDPEGLPTNGIVRVQGSKTGWLLADNTTFKSESYWPAENYLNIWVINFVDPLGLIGYAQLPVSNLPGLENSSLDRLTDGVAIDYRAFGFISNPAPGYAGFTFGRTATHEIGHFFGLRHIWGDDGGACTGSDYCNDTPNQGDSNNGNCQHATVSDACSTSIMFQNYMDYTDDGCMNLFSGDQILRMHAVLADSPRRNSLLSSPGATDPTQVADDLGIKRIISPAATSCSSVTPSIVVRNYGSNAITSAQIQLMVNGSTVETKDFSIPSINYKDSATVSFSTVPLSMPNNTFNFQIILTNAVPDGKGSNNVRTQDVIVPAQGSLPLFETFNTAPATWTIINPDGQTTWANTSAPNASPNNTAMFMDLYYYDSQGEIDQLVSPVFDFSTDTAAILKFDRAYSHINGYDDRLRVIVQTGCDFSNGIVVFDKTGAAMATAPSNSNPFVPSGASQWATETISLTQFLGQTNVRIAFVVTNDYGNNLYLDNVRIITGSYSDVSLTGLKSPSPVTCVNNPAPVITVRNSGTTLITSMIVKTTIGGAIKSQTISGMHLDSGEEQDVTLNTWSLESGSNDITITLQVSNDSFIADNTLNIQQVLNASQQVIPIRQGFDSTYPDWTIVSQNQEMKWTSSLTNKEISMSYKAYNNAELGNTAWLVSPVLDFSRTAKASLFFDLSYGKATKGNERLQILVSSDCGQTFPDVVYDKTGDVFKTVTANASWTPQVSSDWTRTYLNMDAQAGGDQIRIAFIVTNDNGNNLFIDNIEFFTDDDPNPATPDADHLVYYNSDRTDPKVTFKFEEKATVRVQLFNPLGQLVSDEELPDILNQTYHFDTGGKPGIYFVRIQIGNQLSTTKIFIPN